MKTFLFFGVGLFSLGAALAGARFAEVGATDPVSATATAAAASRYRIDASKSKFMVFANRTGLAYFKGKSHQIAVRDFDGEASLDPTALNPASLEMTVKAASLEETRDVYTDK